MYYVQKRMEIAAAHYLELDYESKCKQLHGHNYIVVVYCKSEELDEQGMVYDFAHLKRDIHGVLDHHFLNEIFGFNPTAENMAKWIADQVGETCYKVSVQESEGNIALWVRDDE